MGRAHRFHACKFTGIVLHAYYPDFGSSYPSFCVLGAPILMKKRESAGRSRQGPTFHHRKTLNYNILLCQIRNLRVVQRCANRVRVRQKYFQEKHPCLKKIFQRLKKFFQRLKKFFQGMEKNFQAFSFFLKMFPSPQHAIPLQQGVMEDVENRRLTEDDASLGRTQSDTAQEAARGNGTAS